MKTSWVVGSVVAAHCVIAGGIVMMNGCGTTRPVSSAPQVEPVMPSIEAPATPKKITIDIPPTAIPPSRHVTSAPPPEGLLLPVSKPPVKTWSSDTTSYTVHAGDSIDAICKRHHVSRAEVLALNHIRNPSKIRVGQKILLPGKVTVKYPAKKAAPVAKKSSAASGSKSAPVAAGAGEYVVKSGDMLSKIAQSNKTSVKAIKELNGLTSDRLKVGQKLKIPGKASSAPAVPAVPAIPAMDAAPIVTLPAGTGAVSGASLAIPAPASSNAAAPVGMPAVGVPPAAPVAPAPAAPTGTTKDHIVQPGEDLFSVSVMWDVDVETLRRANNLTGTGNELTPGQVIKIPQ